MSNTAWKLYLGGSTPVARYNQGQLNSITIGDRATFDLALHSGTRTLDTTSDDTIRSTEVFDAVTVGDGATVSITDAGTAYSESVAIDGKLQISSGGKLVVGDGITADSFGELTKYRPHAGSYSPIQLLSGNMKYRDHIPSSAPVSSLLIGLEPSEDVAEQDIVGVWGVIDSIEDIRNRTAATAKYRVSVRVLATIDSYDTFAAAKEDLER